MKLSSVLVGVFAPAILARALDKRVGDVFTLELSPGKTITVSEEEKWALKAVSSLEHASVDI